ncbi:MULTISPECIES: integrase core domain-containing protein [Micrococcales]|uniref:integrase core domain-containing protein n=1 Tax=Micrococcales TaxID=85006 RepID=UPI0035CD2D29
MLSILSDLNSSGIKPGPVHREPRGLTPQLSPVRAAVPIALHGYHKALPHVGNDQAPVTSREKIVASHGGQRTFRHLLRSSNEAVRDHSRFQPGPPRSVDDVECFTLAWIDRYNSARPHTRLGNAPPAEYEAAHCAEPTKSSRPAMTPA